MINEGALEDEWGALKSWKTSPRVTEFGFLSAGAMVGIMNPLAGDVYLVITLSL